MKLRKHAATVLAAALVASGGMAATAHADSGTVIGPSDLATAGLQITPGEGVVANVNFPNGDLVDAPSNGRITGWHGNFDCSDGCGEVRLVQLRGTIDADTFTVVDTSAWTEPTGYGVAAMPASFTVQQHDRLALEGRSGGKVVYGPATGGDVLLSGANLSGSTVTFPAPASGHLALYNADFVPLQPTETTLTADPTPARVNQSVTLTANVTATGVEDFDPQSSDPSGTVTFHRGGASISGCDDVPLVDGVATCVTTSGPDSGSFSVEALYSGDSDYDVSEGDSNLRVRDVSSVGATVTPNPVARRAPVTYKAEIVGARPAGQAHAEQSNSNGTVAFAVDGTPIDACTAQAVDRDGIATCQVAAPPVGGTHTLKVDFSGAKYLTESTATKSFEVLAPAVTLPETVDFASVTAGQTAAQTVRLTNSGGADLVVSAAGLKASDTFAITADDCSGKTLAAGAGCDVQVAFTPAVAGTAYAATLVFSDDAAEGTHTTALTGAAAAAPVPPTAPTPTPTPTPTPQPGATLAPAAGSNPTLTASAPGANRAPGTATLALPLSCPATEECNLDGTLKIATSQLSKSVRAAAVETQTVARFSGVQIAQGKLKTIKLKLSRTFVKSAQRRGIRRIKATLTINTVLGSGQRITTRQQVTVLLPKAPQRKAAAPKARPKFTG